MDSEHKLASVISFSGALAFIAFCLSAHSCNRSDNDARKAIYNNAVDKGCSVGYFGEGKIQVTCPNK